MQYIVVVKNVLDCFFLPQSLTQVDTLVVNNFFGTKTPKKKIYIGYIGHL